MDDETREALRRKKLARRLKNVTVQEVSLVDNPANMRKFLLFKREPVHAPIITEGLDELEINRQFDELPPDERISFLERLKKLAEKVEGLGVGADAFDGSLQGRVDREWAVMSKETRKQVLDRLRKIALRLEEIEGAGLSTDQRDALIDVYKTQVGMIRLYLRDAGLYEELSKAVEERDSDRLREFLFEMDENGIPIISKRLKRTYGPGETATHCFGELPQGGFGWMPKKKRVPQTGRYE